ncbi:thiol oxidase [Malassezia psittaci]|uniref:Sulfhydryl oxidase n=1 Tax=Malassezia psittaci TaxID=1821823 RepID=A0AAF0FG68_9BASI|nr:thiol oxidase [Malassezia psittaci]
MSSRFLRFFLLAVVLVTVPSFVYLSQRRNGLVRDPTTGEWYAADSYQHGNLPAQKEQGHGPIVSNVMKGFSNLWNMAYEPVTKFPAHTTEPSSDVKTASVAEEPPVEGAYAAHMTNATAKAELGRATWHFLHTMTLRFPEQPTKQQSEDLRTFFYMFSKLYPCGDCAAHFQKLLEERPPQVLSRHNAAMWLCGAHNAVNERLGKPEFDCRLLNSTYDCGCGPETAATDLQAVRPEEATGIANIMPIS